MCPSNSDNNIEADSHFLSPKPFGDIDTNGINELKIELGINEDNNE